MENEQAEIIADLPRADEECALAAAAANGHAGIVTDLLKSGAKPSGDGYNTALLAAAKNGHSEIVSILVRAGANINAEFSDGTLLQQAAWRGQTEIISTLITEGADLSIGVQPTRDSPFDPTISFSSPWPLCIAAERGNEAVVRALLSHGTQLQASIENPNEAIQIAAGRGHKEIVQLLIDHGTDVNARDAHGRTGITLGISHPEVVQLLLERGADMDSQAMNGETPLHHAVKGYNENSVDLLLRAGCNAELEDYNGRKPLDILLLDPNSSGASMKLIKNFLEHGCGIRRREMKGWRTMLEAEKTDIIRITERPTVVKTNIRTPRITVDLIRGSMESPCFVFSNNPKLPTRRL